MRDLIRTPRASVATVEAAQPARDSGVIPTDALSAFAADEDKKTQPPVESVEPQSFEVWAAETGVPGRQSESWRRVVLANPTMRFWALGGVACLLAVASGLLLWNRLPRATPVAIGPQTGTATINSRPEGLVVMIDNEVRGRTPIRVAVPLGNHTLQIQKDGEERSIPLVVEAGTTVSQYIDFGTTTAVAASTGRLEVTSDQRGSTVRVDGKVAGNTPLTLSDVTVGPHEVIVGTGDTAIKRTVTVLSGATASIVASGAQPTTTAGWVSFQVPFEMQVFEDGRLIGTTKTERLMLPTGSHRFELVNEALEFRTTVSVQVVVGKTANATIAVPSGSLSVNALPWADVEIDGRQVGTTPLANMSVPIGSHEIVWKHPQRGERRRTIAVTAGSPARVGIDFNQ
jgi:PEGA domain-containing protein